MFAALAAPQSRTPRKPPAPKTKPAAPAPAATEWPIESLAVEGNRHFKTDRILRVAGLKLGQMAGKNEFEAARDRLIATGMFETVGYRFAPGPGGKGYAASFQVLEVEPFYPVRFEDLGVADKEIIAWLDAKEPLFAAEMPGTAAVLDRCAKQITALLASRGKDEKVAGRVVATGPDRFALLFRPARPAPVVAQVSFTGNQAVPARALGEAISGVAIGATYTEERFRVLLENAVRPLYDARGRIRAAFPKITAVPSENVQGLNVAVQVDEGPTYDLAGVKVEGAAGLKPDELLRAAKIKTGELANFDQVNEGVERVRQLLRQNGYLHPKTAVERRIDDKKHVVEVVLKVEEGERYTFGKLEIRGLDLDGEAVIRKMWALQPGKPFRGGYPEYFLNRVREDGVFDNLNKTRADTRIDEQARVVDVTLYFNR
jgi:outer membrane protein insertion porin family